MKKEILVQDGETYYLVQGVDPAWFLPAGPNYVRLTEESKGIDIADGRTALVVTVSDREAFLVTKRHQDALKRKALREYEKAVDEFLVAVLARGRVLENLASCKASAAATTAQLAGPAYDAADQFATELARVLSEHPTAVGVDAASTGEDAR